ncbi:hypothetical protein EMIT0P176_310019 [Pseudomonas sp. IT-P176]
MDQDQKQEHGDLTVGLSGKSGRGGLPADLFALVSRSLVGAGLPAMAICAKPQISVIPQPP